jgi:diguanylate cyclase (GGDEF)-like protein
MQDITERKRIEEMIRYQAYHDTLTDLPNRVLFQNRLRQAIEHAIRYHTHLAVMYLDLDRFKTINDTLGHAAGDQLLKSAAQLLRRLLRAEDTASRLGGDEFTILLSQIAKDEDAAKVARKILEAFATPFTLGDHVVYISTSIGISIFPMDGSDSETLLQAADSALYYAKEQGRNGFSFYAPEMNAKMDERIEMANQLRQAVGQGQIQLYFQPQVDLPSRQMRGAEALLRWQHPELGLMHPGAFLALAEDMGLMESIGAWVLRRACQQVKMWHAAGYPSLTIAVNLSARQLLQVDFVEAVKTILTESDLAPEFLEVELTEAVVIRDAVKNLQVLHRLREMGVRLTLDNFGADHSSLTSLKHFPINTLKIAPSYIDGLRRDPYDAAITSAIIMAARHINVQVIAQGVETEDQLSFLDHSHCDGIQGHLIARAMSAEDFTCFLQHSSAPAVL